MIQDSILTHNKLRIQETILQLQLTVIYKQDSQNNMTVMLFI